MTAAAAIELGAAVAAATSGALLILRQFATGTGWLLVATALTMPAWVVTEPESAVTFTLFMIAVGLPPVLAVVAGIVWPVAPLGRTSKWLIAGALVSVALVGGVLPTLLFNPANAGCNACPPNILEVYPASAAAASLSRLATGLTLLWGPTAAVLAIRRWVRAPELTRRHSWPLLAGAAGIAGLATVSAAYGLALPVGQVDPLVERIRLAQCGLIILMAAGAAARLYLVRVAGRRMARVVLAAIPDPRAVVGSLRTGIADPTLTVRFRRPDGTMIDQQGSAVEDAADRAVLRLSRNAVVFAEICYDQRLVGSADLVRASSSSAALALEYLAARARLRAELQDAAAVRSRIVAAGDAERRRLERNLHDGAQQRLIALGLMLSICPRQDTFDLEHAELDAALAEIRTVARGLFPTSLQEAGVIAALRELGDHTACPLLVSGSVDHPVPPAVGMAIYQLVSDVSQAVPADSPLTVELGGGRTDPARVTITATPTDPDAMQHRLVHAEDRFVAAGGRLTLTVTVGGVILEGVAPCGS